MARNRSRFVTGSQKHRDPRQRSYAFTEHGALMAANVPNSPRAARMSVYVVRAFLAIRRALAELEAHGAVLHQDGPSVGGLPTKPLDFLSEKVRILIEEALRLPPLGGFLEFIWKLVKSQLDKL